MLEPVLTSLQEKTDIRIAELNFSLSQINHYEEQALQLAVEAAQEKAQAISRKMGLQIGKAITIEQISAVNSPYVPYGTYLISGTDGGYIYDNLLAVTFSEITIKVQVSVAFEIK
jgi:uncharacterized protein YggE